MLPQATKPPARHAALLVTARPASAPAAGGTLVLVDAPALAAWFGPRADAALVQAPVALLLRPLLLLLALLLLHPAVLVARRRAVPLLAGAELPLPRALLLARRHLRVLLCLIRRQRDGRNE